MENYQNFGEQLRDLRKRAGLTLRELAEKVNVNFTYLSKIENGTLPPPSEKVIRRLAEVLDYDKDELLTLAGIIPSDIAEILKDRKARERLRAEQAKRAARGTGIKIPDLPKVSLPLKGLYRLALPVFLVIAVAASIWFASPTQALKIEYPNQPSSGTLGSSYTFYVKVSIEDLEHLPLQKIDVRIYNVNDPTTYKATLASLPLGDQVATSHTISEGATSGTATVAADAEDTWAYIASATGNVTWESVGYQFVPATSGGYGYSPGVGTTWITYTIVWTPPSGWPTGSYKIDTILTTSTQNPGGGTTFTKSSSEFTLSAAAAEPVGGGGGGAVTSAGTTYLYDVVNSVGKFVQDVTAKSADKKVALEIDRGVIGKTIKGQRLTKITIEPMTTPPPPPEHASIIGLTYDFGPAGATFVPPIRATVSYEPAILPAGFNELNLKLAYYETSNSHWVILENIEVDTINHTVSADVPHFTAFAVIAFTEPATFVASDLTINPTELNAGEASSVTVTIANTGDLSGTYDVVLKINNISVETKTVTIAGHDSQEVSFSVSQDTAGTYSISIDGLSGVLTVKALPVPEPEPEPVPPEPEPEPVPPEPEPEPIPPVPEPEPAPPAPVPEKEVNWWLIGGIIAVVIIVAIIVWMLILRRRYA